MDIPKVSIIVLNWNGCDDTIECLESLKKITYPNYEVIVVDNASSGNDVSILRERYSNYIQLIVNDQNYGYPEGNNIGMRSALANGADYLLLLNNDTVVDPQFVTELLKVAETDHSIGILGSKLYHYYHPEVIQSAGGRIIWWLGLIRDYGIDEHDVGQHNKVSERDYVWGTSFLIKRSVLDTISFMNTYFYFGIEEYDYCTRAKRAGYKIVYVPESKVWHKFGASRAKLSQFPETQRTIKKSRGAGKYKYYYHLFRTYCPPVLFILPLAMNIAMIGPFIVLIWRRDWKTMRIETKKKASALFSLARKPRSHH